MRVKGLDVILEPSDIPDFLEYFAGLEDIMLQGLHKLDNNNQPYRGRRILLPGMRFHGVPLGFDEAQP